MSESNGLDKVREEILLLKDEQYREFQKKLLPEVNHFVGVRLPKLRRLAKKTAAEYGIEYLEASLNRKPEEELFEEIMLQGMMIGYMQEDISVIFSYTERFLPKINNWSVCDSFCSGWKHAGAYQGETWEWLMGLLESRKEFTVRFVIVMLLDYYINDTYIDQLFPIFDSVRHDGYYVKMALAWAVSICYVRYPGRCMSYLENHGLDDFTYRKALQKITESRCVTEEDKEIIKEMKAGR